MLFPPAAVALCPCVDDWQRLLAISDLCEEAGDLPLAQHCRAVARLWQHPRTTRRSMVHEGWDCWARWSNTGWSRAVVVEVSPTIIQVELNHRVRYGAPFSGNWQLPVSSFARAEERAWFDLEPRGDWEGTRYEKPRPRRGYGAPKNAALAAALTGGVLIAKDEGPTPFGVTT